MATKQYDAGKAMNPGQEETGGEIEYSKFIEQLPEEFRDEIEEALAAMLNYVHSEQGTAEILELLQKETGNIGAQIGKIALMSMDAADPEHQWSDSAKVFAGFFAVKEVANLAREARIADIDEKDEAAIFKAATQNYLHAMIKSKPTQQEREAEAIRIQKEVEPLMTEKMRETGRNAAKEHGIPIDDKPTGRAPAGAAQQQRGLLE